MSQLIHLVHFALALGVCALGGCADDGGAVVRTDVPSGTPGPAADLDARDNLRYLGRYEGPNFVEIQDIETDGRFAWMCTAVQGLMKYDLADPARPAFVYSIGSSAGSSRYPRCFRLALAPGRAYVSNRGDEIQPDAFVAAFDVSGSRPSETAVWNQGEAGAADGLHWSEDRLYVAAQGRGLHVLAAPRDGSLTELLSLTKGLEGPRQVRVDAVRKLALVADGPGGLKVIDLSDPAALTLLGGAPTTGQAVDLHLDPDAAKALAYVAAASGGLEIYDYSDPVAPRRLSAVATPGTALGVSVSGGHAFVAAWNDLRVFDVSDSTSPRLVAVERVWTSEPYPRVMAVAAHDDLVLAGEWTGLVTHRFVAGLEAPQVSTPARVVDFGRVVAGVTPGPTRVVVFANEGGAPLTFEGARVSPEDLFKLADAEPRTVAPGQETFLEVEVVVRTEGRIKGTLTLLTDDPDEPELVVQLSANTPGLGVGDDAPSFEMPDLDGAVWSSEGMQRQGHAVLLAYFATF